MLLLMLQAAVQLVRLVRLQLRRVQAGRQAAGLNGLQASVVNALIGGQPTIKTAQRAADAYRLRLVGDRLLIARVVEIVGDAVDQDHVLLAGRMLVVAVFGGVQSERISVCVQ